MFVFKVDKSVLTPSETELMVSGSVNVYEVKFCFSEDWKGLEKTIIFRTGRTTICTLLKTDDEIIKVPWECLDKPHNHLYIGIYGTKMGNWILPTIWADMGEVVKGAEPCDQIPQDPSPSLLDEILEKLSELGSHAVLEDREIADQHPIEAITDLQKSLDTIPRAITSEELRKMLMEEGGSNARSRRLLR